LAVKSLKQLYCWLSVLVEDPHFVFFLLADDGILVQQGMGNAAVFSEASGSRDITTFAFAASFFLSFFLP
jgi:hypothetical protein